MTMSSPKTNKVTVMYYLNGSLELQHETLSLEVSTSGRAVLDQDFKRGKSILAVYAGEVDVLNKMGDRLEASNFITEVKTGTFY